MPKTLIVSNPEYTKEKIENFSLNVAEFFMDTIQGEGVYRGYPAAFLRLKNCTLNCTWCDSTEVWRKGNPYSIEELLLIFEKASLHTLLVDKRYHLIVTGGSPLLQQKSLVKFFEQYLERFGYVPFIEIENECVLKVDPEFARFISCFNNSPKLSNSGMRKEVRYKPEVIKDTAHYPHSYFKFVIEQKSDWDIIQQDYLDAGLIRRNQIILMPCGSTRQELNLTQELVVEISVREKVLFSGRDHVTIWDKKTGV